MNCGTVNSPCSPVQWICRQTQLVLQSPPYPSPLPLPFESPKSTYLMGMLLKPAVGLQLLWGRVKGEGVWGFYRYGGTGFWAYPKRGIGGPASHPGGFVRARWGQARAGLGRVGESGERKSL